ncbi:MAG: acyl-CoA dehydrogenase family protein [Myxococcota bacterium]
MDFSLDAERREFQRSVANFAKAKLSSPPDGGGFWREGFDLCREFGLTALPLPEAYGGHERDIVDCLLAMQALGRHCPDTGLLLALNSHLWTCALPLAQFGSEAQKDAYLPRLATGELIGGHAVSEPEAGSDAFAMRTRATASGDGGHAITGSKVFSSNAPISDVLLVFARTDVVANNPMAGITCFIVDTTREGVTLGPAMAKMGLEGAPTGEVFFDDCDVPATHVLGKVGGGAAIFNAEMEWERCCLFATHLGTMQRQLATCVRYANTRKQFGKPIGKQQAIAHKLADMKVRIELGELMLHKAAWLKQQGKRAPLEAAIAKLHVSEAFVASSLDAIQIHGGNGYMRDYGVERDLRDAVGTKIYSGTSEIQRNMIASWLGL